MGELISFYPFNKVNINKYQQRKQPHRLIIPSQLSYATGVKFVKSVLLSFYWGINI